MIKVFAIVDILFDRVVFISQDKKVLQEILDNMKHPEKANRKILEQVVLFKGVP